ncbi:hypothetical protein AC249_AIPGENE19617 [Exaiptasia diaphana]|nr:hypothetical protein AC249_AIPGENE19617 [Exaiptasia diaphana]
MFPAQDVIVPLRAYQQTKMSCKDRITKFYWFSFGLWVNFQRYVMLWVATEDILAGSLQSTAIVMIAFTVPDIFSKAVSSPWIVKRISFRPAFILYSSMLVAIQLIFVFVNIVNVRLAGMCVLGFANGLGTITAAKLLGFYSDSAGVYISGDNCGSVVASLLYTDT